MTERLSRIRRDLAETGCDAFFNFSTHTNEYLTGFRGSTSAVLITQEHAHFLCDFRYTEQARKQVAGFEVHEVCGCMEVRAGERLEELGTKRAGFDPTVLSVYQRDTLAEAFEGELEALPDLVPAMRQVKDTEEVTRIREACHLAEEALLALVPTLEEGMTEREFAARLEYEFKLRGAQGASFDSIALFGPRSSLPHGMPGEKPLERGDIVLIDCGCIRDSYCSDLTRTYVFGTIPGAWFEEIYRVTFEAQAAALEAVKPGAVARNVDAVARDAIRDAGYGDYFGHGLGHGVGLEVHELPRLNMQAETVLQPGMAVTVEPGIYLPGRGGVRIEDLVVVTETGCEVLTQASKEFEVLGA